MRDWQRLREDERQGGVRDAGDEEEGDCEKHKAGRERCTEGVW